MLQVLPSHPADDENLVLIQTLQYGVSHLPCRQLLPLLLHRCIAPRRLTENTQIKRYENNYISMFYHFLLCNTKGENLNNIPAVLFHIIQINGKGVLSSSKLIQRCSIMRFGHKTWGNQWRLKSLTTLKQCVNRWYIWFKSNSRGQYFQWINLNFSLYNK